MRNTDWESLDHLGEPNPDELHGDNLPEMG